VASTIGIKIANGEFYSIIDENSQVKKRLVLTTVHNEQRSVQIDLYKSYTRTMADALYIGSLVVEDIKPRLKGEPSIEMVISSTEEGNITADAVDLDASIQGERQTLNVSLKSMDEDNREYEIPDYELDQNQGPPTGLFEKAREINEEKEKRNFPWLVVVCAALVIVAIGLAVWLFLFQGSFPNFSIARPRSSASSASSVPVQQPAQTSAAAQTAPPQTASQQTPPQPAAPVTAPAQQVPPQTTPSQTPPPQSQTPPPQPEVPATAAAQTAPPQTASQQTPPPQPAASVAAPAQQVPPAQPALPAPAAQTQPPVIQAPVTAPAPAAPAYRTRPVPPVASYRVPSVIPREGVPYQIRWGDTLWDIAEAFYRNPWLYPRIAQFNNIRNPDLIISGRTIRVPPRN